MELNVSAKKDVMNPNSVDFNERQRQLDDEKRRDAEARKREKNSPYSNWYQFNRDHTADMIWLTTNHPKAQALLLFLLDQMDNYNAVVCSYAVLQEALGISRPTITRAIKLLKEKGFITIYKSGTANVYCVNKQLAWGSWGRNFKYAKFDANIIISETEQEKVKIEYEKQKVINIKDN